MNINITKGTTYSDNQINEMIERINAGNGESQGALAKPSDLQIAQAKLMLMEEEAKPQYFDAPDINSEGVFEHVQSLQKPTPRTPEYNQAYADLNYGATSQETDKAGSLYNGASNMFGSLIKSAHEVKNRGKDIYADFMDDRAQSKAGNTKPSLADQRFYDDLQSNTETQNWKKYGQSGNTEYMKLLSQHKRNAEGVNNYITTPDNGWKEQAMATRARTDVYNNDQTGVNEAGSNFINSAIRAPLETYANYHDGVRQRRMADNDSNLGLQALSKNLPNSSYSQALKDNAYGSRQELDFVNGYYQTPLENRAGFLSTANNPDHGASYGETAKNTRNYMGKEYPLSPNLQDSTLANLPGIATGIVADVAAYPNTLTTTGMGPSGLSRSLGLERELNQLKPYGLGPENASLAREKSFNNPYTWVENGIPILGGVSRLGTGMIANSALGRKMADGLNKSGLSGLKNKYDNIKPSMVNFGLNQIRDYGGGYLSDVFETKLDNMQRVDLGLPQEPYDYTADEYLRSRAQEKWKNELRRKYSLVKF